MTIRVGADHGLTCCGINHAYVDRIDRSNIRGGVHQVGSTPGSIHVRVAVLLAVCVADVGTYLQPLLGLVVSLQTTCETLVAGVLDDTVLIQVACTGIE